MDTPTKRKPLGERLASAQERVDDARKAAKAAQARVSALRRELSKTERRKRTHQLIRMGGILSSLGVETPEEVDKLIGFLRTWVVTDMASGSKIAVIDDALRKLQASRTT